MSFYTSITLRPGIGGNLKFIIGPFNVKLLYLFGCFILAVLIIKEMLDFLGVLIFQIYRYMYYL